MVRTDCRIGLSGGRNLERGPPPGRVAAGRRAHVEPPRATTANCPQPCIDAVTAMHGCASGVAGCCVVATLRHRRPPEPSRFTGLSVWVQGVVLNPGYGLIWSDGVELILH